MPERYMVTVNGHRQFADLSKEEAYRTAEKWGWGLTQKHRDPKSHALHVEVKRDRIAEREFDDEYSRWKEGREQDFRTIGGR